jgi:hypothetical protein
MKEADEPLYHLSLAAVKIREGAPGKSDAELHKKYFCTIKFSTQVLISVWKIGSRQGLTSLSSTYCCGLHNFRAAHLMRGANLRRRQALATDKSRKKRRMAEAQGKIFHSRSRKCNHRDAIIHGAKQFSTTSAVSRGEF